jgi:indole-3-acetate monooxygenase
MAVPTIETLRAALPAFAEEARRRGRDFEAAHALADDFTDRLKSAGVYRILLPPAFGGLGGSLVDWFDMGLALAEADASTGWAVIHGAGANAILQSLADRSFAKDVFSDPNVCCAWSNAPLSFKADRTEEGLRVNARWSYVTGCTAATYVGGMLPLPDATGAVRPTTVLMPIAAARIDRTWDTMGLSGTGSHDVVMEDVLVPHRNTFTWPGGEAVGTYPWAISSPSTWFISTSAAIVHLGLARRMLDETRRELAGKKDRFSQAPLLSHPAILRVLEKAEGTLHLATAGMRVTLADIWEHAKSATPLSSAQRIVVRNASSAAVHLGTDLARAVFDVAGTTAVRRSGELERLFRDANCLTQHIAPSDFAFEFTGRVRGGFAPLDARV